MVRNLDGTVNHAKAELGLLIVLARPTRGMMEAAEHSGSYVNALTGTTYPKVQIATIEDLMAGKRPNLPTAILPYIQAAPKKDHEEMPLF